MDNDVGNVDNLHLGVEHASDIGELHEFFDGGVEYHNWITR